MINQYSAVTLICLLVHRACAFTAFLPSHIKSVKATVTDRRQDSSTKLNLFPDFGNIVVAATSTEGGSNVLTNPTTVLLGVELALLGATVPLFQKALDESKRRAEEIDAEAKVVAELQAVHAKAERLKMERKQQKEAERVERKKKIEESIAAARAEEERIQKNKEEAVRLAEEKALAKKAAEEAAAREEAEKATKVVTAGGPSSGDSSSQSKPDLKP